MSAGVAVPVAVAVAPQDENAQVAEWRAKRLASLTSETGWLTPVALYWLKEGENSFGRASGQAFSLDDAALAPDTGVFVLKDHHVRYVAHATNGMTYLGKPVTSMDLLSDEGDRPTELIAGTLHFMVIDRAGHLGVRVRDSVSPNRVQFKGLQYYPDAGRLAHSRALRTVRARAHHPDREYFGHDRANDLARSDRVRTRGTHLAPGCDLGGSG